MSKINVHFYQCTKHNIADKEFELCCKEIADRHSQHHNWVDVEGNQLRIHNYKETPEFIYGELVRRQTEDIPPIARDGEPLADSSDPIAHRAAFGYQKETGILGIEERHFSPRYSSFVRLYQQEMGHRGFTTVPLLREGELKKLLEGDIRKLSIRVAEPKPEMVEDDDIGKSIVYMRKITNAPTVEIQLAFETAESGTLNQANVMSMVERVMSWKSKGMRVKKLQAKIAGDSDILDFLGAKLVYSQNSPIEKSKLNEHYAERSKVIREGFLKHKAHIDFHAKMNQ